MSDAYGHIMSFDATVAPEVASGERQVCIFLSDGAAMQYNYFSGRACFTTWADWLPGVQRTVLPYSHRFEEPVQFLNRISK